MRGVSIGAWSGALALAMGAAQALSACSPSAGQTAMDNGPGSTAGGSQGGQGGLLWGSGSTSSVGGVDNLGGFGNVPGTGSATGLDGGSCASEVHQGESLPLDMYFVVDTSGSMNEKVQGGTKWSVVSGALVAFLNDPLNSDIGTGIEYFPSIDPNAPKSCVTTADCTTAAGNFGTCQGINIIFACLGCFCSLADACLTSAYVPAVPLQLPPNHAAVVTDIGTRGPGGGTPTRPALEGAVAYVHGWASQNPGRTSVIVLATDGDPTGCQTNAVADVANIAAGALGQGIRTFVIGVGSSLTALNQVAAAGGTNTAFVLDTAGDVAKSFSDALAAIHGQAASCDFKVPTSTSSGQKIDLNFVNVNFTPLGSQAANPLLRTADGTSATCGADPGWYYDNPSAPTLIQMCPSTCGDLKHGGRVGVELGCQKTRTRPR